ncbi:MAG: hypothetical protein Ct9H300mP11_19390 [Chloroflexota bacterium]|nr:MAG: hypothetical protein CM1200mP27_06970 [Chloroflexota bacterium]GIT44003.1 MAG: hypothetical protein Ct9H300mP11_19390 [Chloroflexota bacterium]
MASRLSILRENLPPVVLLVLDWQVIILGYQATLLVY